MTTKNIFYIQESVAGKDKIDTAYLVGNVAKNLIKVKTHSKK